MDEHGPILREYKPSHTYATVM